MERKYKGANFFADKIMSDTSELNKHETRFVPGCAFGAPQNFPGWICIKTLLEKATKSNLRDVAANVATGRKPDRCSSLLQPAITIARNAQCPKVAWTKYS